MGAESVRSRADGALRIGKDGGGMAIRLAAG